MNTQNIDAHEVAVCVAGICTDGEEHIVYNVQCSVPLTGSHFKFFNGPLKAGSTSLLCSASFPDSMARPRYLLLSSPPPSIQLISSTYYMFSGHIASQKFGHIASQNLVILLRKIWSYCFAKFSHIASQNFGNIASQIWQAHPDPRFFGPDKK